MKLFICQVYLRGVATGEGEDIVDAPEIWEWHINKCIDFKFNELQMEIELVHNIRVYHTGCPQKAERWIFSTL